MSNYCNRKGVECDCLSENSVCNSDNCHRKLPDKKLIDKEIVKALEDCITHNESCISCPSYKFCDNHDSKIMMSNTLDLINRKNAEIEWLRNCNDGNLKSVNKLNDLINRLQAENERLKKGWKADVILTANVKAEAYKECLEWLKEEYWIDGTGWLEVEETFFINKFNERIKEMECTSNE